MKYLATTAISDIWDRDHELLLLGPWCITEKSKKILREKKHTNVLEYRLTTNEWISAFNYCDKVYKILLPALTSGLNRLHHTNHSEKYWETITGAWLFHYIHIFYDRYIRLLQVKNNYKDVFTHAVVSIDFTFKDTAKFINNFIMDFPNLILFSIISKEIDITIEYKKIKNPLLADLLEQIDMSVDRKMSKPFYVRLIKNLINLIAKSFVGSSGVEMYRMHSFPKLSYLQFSLLMKKNMIGGLYFQNYENNDFKNNPNFRNLLKISNNEDDFIKLAAKHIPEFIPATFIEGYSKLAQEAKELVKTKHKVKAIISTVGWKHDQFRVYSATQEERGTKLIAVQHGAYYGQSLTHLDRLEIRLHDAFLSWGWTENGTNGSKIQPIPSFHLSRLLDTYRPIRDSIIYISACFDRYRIRFSSHQDLDIASDYFEDQIKLFRLLDAKVMHRMFYRPYPDETGNFRFKKIHNSFPAIRPAATAKATDWLKNSILAIIDHPGTVMFEALAINIPCILFWSPDVWPMRKKAAPHFDKLRAAGILHDSPETVAPKINRIIKETPLLWWTRPAIQKAREHFLGRFGYASKNWVQAWSKMLKNMENEKFFQKNLYPSSVN